MAVDTHASAELPAAGARTARGARGPLLLAAVLVLAMAVLWILAELVPYVRAHDALLLARATSLQDERTGSLARGLLSTLEVPYALLWGAAIVAVALTRGRPRLAVAAAAIMILSPVTADLIKPILAHAHDRAGATRVGAASWPSGHATASMALVCALALAVPRGARPAVLAAGSIYVLAVAAALLLLAWHMPSDVLGGWLLAGVWTALAVAALRAANNRRPERRVW
ncbi:MAG TPA: phosphatase PAP2 family protein [Solirubrobacteraceae bacterium]|nr:phosphatase PAP2 family protein [Solirubrobacteraceae bacterium]